MPKIILELGHHELVVPAIDWEVVSNPESALAVTLIASIQSHPAIPPFPGTHRGATTLAIQMDRAVAIALSERIRELARSMDWPLPPEGERQA